MLLVSLLIASRSEACSCMPVELQTVFRQCVAVFSGRVIRVEESRVRGYNGVLATVLVLESWKGAHVGQICDAVMPTDFLSRWVRDRALMPVEAGIRKLTGELADVLCIDRGYLRAGAPADVVVLDWDELSTGPIRRVRDMPAGGDRLLADAPAGIDTVLVNGVPIRDSGKSLIDELDELPGAVLRSDPTR